MADPRVGAPPGWHDGGGGGGGFAAHPHPRPYAPRGYGYGGGGGGEMARAPYGGRGYGRGDGGGPSGAPSVVASPYRIFIGKLSVHTTADSLRAYLVRYLASCGHPSPVDTIVDVFVPCNHEGMSRGYSFVTFSDDVAQQMMLVTRDHAVDGKMVVVDLPTARGTGALRDGGMPGGASSVGMPGGGYRGGAYGDSGGGHGGGAGWARSSPALAPGPRPAWTVSTSRSLSGTTITSDEASWMRAAGTGRGGSDWASLVGGFGDGAVAAGAAAWPQYPAPLISPDPRLHGSGGGRAAAMHADVPDVAAAMGAMHLSGGWAGRV